MKIQETEILLKEMFAVDGRYLEADKIKAWHNVISFMPLDIAQRALRMARADERINYVEPKHIIAKAKEAAEALDREEQRAKPIEKPKHGTPMPRCIHGEGLALCDKCCHTLHVYHRDTHGHLEYGDDKCYEYAKENLFG